MFVPSACSKKDTAQTEKINLKDLLNSSSTVYRDRIVVSKNMGQQMKYSIYLPPYFDEEKEYPILYLLHGMGDNQNGWLDKGDAQKIADSYMKADGVPMIIVMPDAKQTFYIDKYESYMHEELMPEVESAYKFNGNRAVAGLSMGGFGTWYHALKYPEKFTYAYAMSPASWDGFKDLVDATADKSLFPAFTIEVGNQDASGVDNELSKSIADYMKQEGLTVDFIARDGQHDWTFWKECLPKALNKIGESFK